MLEFIEQATAPTAAELRSKILNLVRNFYDDSHGHKKFEPGKTRVAYSGRVYDAEEMVNLVAASLDFGLTLGPCGATFERRMQEFFGSDDFVLVNSGSSANLLMVATICSPELETFFGEASRPRLIPGDEVITPAVTFPTTLAPIIQHQLMPVFVDCEVGTYNINPTLIEEAIGPRTRCLMMPHTVGNPFALDVVMEIAKRHNLWVLEDACDALGATFDGKIVGSFGDMASLSFYPAHHITMGEGGGVAVSNPRLRNTARSIRDGGRDCLDADATGRDRDLGAIPWGYKREDTYTNIGYDLKPTDLQAAIGLAQIEKAPGFIEHRRHNFWRLYNGLKPLENFFILPTIDPKANPSPFGFPITVRAGVDRNKVIRYLEDSKIETRLVFGGNILNQPGFQNIRCRVHGSLAQSDVIMRQTFFIGVYPGLNDEMIDYMLEVLFSLARTL